MKIRNRIAALLLAVCMLVSLVPNVALAAHIADEDHVETCGIPHEQCAYGQDSTQEELMMMGDQVALSGTPTQAQGASFVTRSDGVWLWPTDYYAISDWAGCNAYGTPVECFLCKNYAGRTHMVTCAADHSWPTYGHNGIDIPVDHQPVKAMADGKVVVCAADNSRGKYIVIEHPTGTQGWSYYSYYQHLNTNNEVSVGQNVKVGDRIAQSGATGVGTGPHLHVGLLLGASNLSDPIGTLEWRTHWVVSAGFQEGRILNNPALNSPAGMPADPMLCGNNLTLHAGSVMYTLNKAEVSIGSHTHSYKASITQEATCTQSGTRTYTCEGCGHSYTEAIPATGHSYISEVTEPTCTTAGFTTYTCSNCGDSYVETSDGWSEWSTEYPTGVDASRIEEKVQYSALEKEYTTSASDTLEGWTYCGTTVGDWGAVQTTTTAPVESDTLRITGTKQTGWGYYHWCNYYYNGGNNWNIDSIPYGSPNYWHGYTASSALPAISFPDQGGQQAYGGSGNGAAACPYNFYIWFRNTDADVYTYSYQTREIVNQFYKWPDTWSEWSDDEITATEDCQVRTRTVYRYYALGHSFTNYVSDGNATCTQDGTKTAVCDRCTSTDTIVDVGSAMGHNMGSWYIIKEPTATENGVEERSCSHCDYTEQRGIVKWENPFVDVQPGSYYYNPVLWAVENGITSGTSPTTFAPNNLCVRAQVVTFLWRAAGSPEPKSNHNPFADVKATDYYYKAVLWALENGITSGVDATHFGSNAYCNRAQVVTFLHKVKGAPAPTTTANPFADVAEGTWYYNAVLWAVENGVTSGMSPTTFGPGNNCNRAQIVTFLYAAYHK